jgi:molybdate transport system ATP-binding protein
LSEAALVCEAGLRFDGFSLDATLSVDRGETLVLVGPSGAGKSSLLALVAGLLRGHSGRVVCDGVVWFDAGEGVHLPPEKRRVGLVFQDYALFPHLDVVQNVAYGPRSRGRSRGESESAAARWTERLQLADVSGRPASSLSGGQRQRVALARALATEPGTLLLDEPFGALDVTTRGAVRSELRGFLRECGLPTVLVTHDPVDAHAFGDRIAVLEGGRISQVGTRETLLAEPRSAFVADLAGLNLFRADLAPGHGLREARAGAVSFHVLAEHRDGPSFVAFSPADVSLAAERSAGSAQNVFSGRVVEVWPLPDRLRVVLDVGVLVAAEVTREAAASLEVDVGRWLWASVKATAIRVYA